MDSVVRWEEAQEWLSDFRRWPEFWRECCVIQPEEGSATIPFILNPIQQYIHSEVIAPLVEKNLPIRVSFLKARQTGVTTYLEVLGWTKTITTNNYNSIVIAQESDVATEIFRIIRRLDDNYARLFEGKLGFPILARRKDRENAIEYKKPSKSHRSRMFLDKTLIERDSMFRIKSAEKRKTLGRAGTYQFIHASEAAYWPTLTGSLGSLLGACHEKPWTCVFIETTANGMNLFYNFWHNLKVGAMDVPSMWVKLFIPYYWDRQYEATYLKKCEFIDDYEEALFKRISDDETLRTKIDPTLDDKRIWRKILWRRQIIQDKYFGDEEYFAQEFPSTESEAFMFSGISAFSVKSLQFMETQIKKPIWTGNIALKKEVSPETREDPMSFETITEDVVRYNTELEEHDRGQLKVWEQPHVDHKYVTFADVAEGKAVEGAAESKSKHDFSCVQIIKVTSFPPALEQVAIWHGNVDPDLLADVLVAISQYYNFAHCGWEANGAGRSVGYHLVNRLGYSNYYMRTDNETGKNLKKPGWLTTWRTKPDMVAMIQRFVRQLEINIHDVSTLTEMKSYARLEDNSWGAAQGHDDRVIALAGALCIGEPIIYTLKRQADYEKKQRDENAQGDPWAEEEFIHPVLGSEY